MSSSPDFIDRIESSKLHYSFFERNLLGKGSSAVEIRVAELEGVKYKIVNRTPRGKANAFLACGEILRNAPPGVAVPKLAYADSDRIVVEWIDGTTSNETPMSHALAMQLARTAAEGIHNRSTSPTSETNEHIKHYLTVLVTQKLLSKDLAARVLDYLETKAKVPAEEPVGICFGDTALKNFVQTSDGSMYYIDIFGIYPHRVGHCFMRLLDFMPAELRPDFESEFIKRYGDPTLEIYRDYFWVAYLIQRAYSKASTGRALNRLKTRRQARRAVAGLQDFLDRLDGS